MSQAREGEIAPSDVASGDALPAGPSERAGRAQAARTLGLVPSLDGLRGVGIILVVYVHLAQFIPAWTTVTPGLFVFMNVFFVMSGFLITSILLREHDKTGRVRPKPFYQGRVLRLFPALCAMVAVEFVWALWRHYPLDYEFKAVGSAVTYLSNWGVHAFGVSLVQEAKFPTGMGQLWSLAVEEQFYLFFPIVLIALLAVARRFRLAPLVAVAAAIVVIGVHRATTYLDMPATQFHAFGWATLYERTDFRLDDILWGVLLAMLWVRGWFPRRGLALAGWLGAGVLVVTWFTADLTSGWIYLWGMPIMAIAGVAVVLACVEAPHWRLRRVFELKWLCTLGVVSYGIYVWHLLADAVVETAGPNWPAGLQVAAAIGLTALMTVGSWYLIEKPFLRVKDRLRRRNRAPSPTPTAPVPAAETPPVPAEAPANGVASEPIAPDVALLFDVSPTPD